MERRWCTRLIRLRYLPRCYSISCVTSQKFSMAQQFGAFTASELYCPKCKRSQPVRERLLLVLPSGELHEYVCSRCATSLGERETKGSTLPPQARPQRRSQAPRKLVIG